MKKLQIISLTALIVLSVSCQKDPDTNKLDDDYIVYTNYDIGTDFKSFNTFHVIDSILIIGNSDKAAYWNNDNSQKIVNAYAIELENAGYLPAEEAEEADIILQLSYISNTYYFTFTIYPLIKLLLLIIIFK